MPQFDGLRNPFVKEVFMNNSVPRHDLWLSCAECIWAHTQHVLITEERKISPTHLTCLVALMQFLLVVFQLQSRFFVLLNHSHNEYQWFLPYVALSVSDMFPTSGPVKVRKITTNKLNYSSWTVWAKSRLPCKTWACNSVFWLST